MPDETLKEAVALPVETAALEELEDAASDDSAVSKLLVLIVLALVNVDVAMLVDGVLVLMDTVIKGFSDLEDSEVITVPVAVEEPGVVENKILVEVEVVSLSSCVTGESTVDAEDADPAEEADTFLVGVAASGEEVAADVETPVGSEEEGEAPVGSAEAAGSVGSTELDGSVGSTELEGSTGSAELDGSAGSAEAPAGPAAFVETIYSVFVMEARLTS